MLVEFYDIWTFCQHFANMLTTCTTKVAYSVDVFCGVASLEEIPETVLAGHFLWMRFGQTCFPSTTPLPPLAGQFMGQNDIHISGSTCGNCHGPCMPLD